MPAWMADVVAVVLILPGQAQTSLVRAGGCARCLQSANRCILQIRAETFNFLNDMNFQGLSTALGSTNCGQGNVVAREPRRIQVAAKLISPFTPDENLLSLYFQ